MRANSTAVCRRLLGTHLRGARRAAWRRAVLLALACIGVAQGASEAPVGRKRVADDPGSGPASVAIIAELKARAGQQGEAFESALQRAYPGYLAVAACEASLKREGVRDFVLGLVEPESNGVVYAALTQERGGRYAVAELLRFPQGKGVGVKCMPWTEIRRIRTDYAGRYFTGAPKQPAYTDFGLLSRFDLACVDPPQDWVYLCYGYDRKRKMFDAVGAWTSHWAPKDVHAPRPAAR